MKNEVGSNWFSTYGPEKGPIYVAGTLPSAIGVYMKGAYLPVGTAFLDNSLPSAKGRVAVFRVSVKDYELKDRQFVVDSKKFVDVTGQRKYGQIRFDGIVSGGQTGVNQAALWAAKEAGVPTSGLAPLGFLTEDGLAPWLAEFGIVEIESDNLQRAWANVSESDGTVIYISKRSDLTCGGTNITLEECKRYRRPLHIVVAEIPQTHDVTEFLAWIVRNGIRSLNVAGPRRTKAPDLGDFVKDHLGEILKMLKG